MTDLRHLYEFDAEISYRQELLRKAMQRNPRRPSVLRRHARGASSTDTDTLR